jgi:hypothetical protein
MVLRPWRCVARRANRTRCGGECRRHLWMPGKRGGGHRWPPPLFVQAMQPVCTAATAPRPRLGAVLCKITPTIEPPCIRCAQLLPLPGPVSGPSHARRCSASRRPAGLLLRQPLLDAPFDLVAHFSELGFSSSDPTNAAGFSNDQWSRWPSRETRWSIVLRRCFRRPYPPFGRGE